MGSRARGGWLASGRGALSFGEQHAIIVSCLNGRGALSFGSSRREEEQCQDETVQFFFYTYIFICGDQKWGTTIIFKAVAMSGVTM